MTTTPAAGLAEMRDRTRNIALLMQIRNACNQNGGVRSIDFGKASGDDFIAALTDAISALAALTTLTARVGEVEGLSGLLKEASESLDWWHDQHGCCSRDDELIAKLDAAVLALEGNNNFNEESSDG